MVCGWPRCFDWLPSGVCVSCAGDGNVCFYGVCYYCKPAEAACAAGEMMEGSLTLWLPKWYDLTTRRHPYQRTYVEGKKARCVFGGGIIKHTEGSKVCGWWGCGVPLMGVLCTGGKRRAGFVKHSSSRLQNIIMGCWSSLMQPSSTF